MSLPVPLRVRLKTARGYRDVTRHVDDLVIRSTIPGGFASCAASLHRPLTIQPDEVDHYGKLYVVDSRNGLTVGEGRLEDPGRSAGRDGTVWNLTAIGPSAHAEDRTVPLIYVDQRVNIYVPASEHEKSINVQFGEEDNPGIVFQIPRGTVATTTYDGAHVYKAIAEAGQTVARASATWTSGVTDADWALRLVTRTGVGAGTVVDSDAANTAGGSLVGLRGGAPAIPAGHDTLEWAIRRTNTNQTVANDATYFGFFNIAVRALLKDASGADITSGAEYVEDTVLTSQVVADLLGRLLTQYDGPNALITPSGFQVDQLAYPDGTTAEKVLADLIQLEPDPYYWAAWESNSAGKHRFEYVPWPLTVRYEATAVDGYDSTGSADDLYDEVAVRWRDASGRIRTTIRTQTVPELAAAGLTRTALIDLGDEIGSAAAADAAGDGFLSTHAVASNAGRLVVSRPILDRQMGRMVMPWEIRPGHLVRVGDILPRPGAGLDAFGATRPDGVSVFRIVGTEFQASDASAVLQLDSPAPTVARMLADQKRRFIGQPVTRQRPR